MTPSVPVWLLICSKSLSSATVILSNISPVVCGLPIVTSCIEIVSSLAGVATILFLTVTVLPFAAATDEPLFSDKAICSFKNKIAEFNVVDTSKEVVAEALPLPSAVP